MNLDICIPFFLSGKYRHDKAPEFYHWEVQETTGLKALDQT